MLEADVVVVGGGPAGAAAAITLARAGREVVVVDRARFPRDKCCGDGLTAGALRHYEALGLRPDSVASWQNFIETRITLDVDETIPVATRQALEALPSSAHLYGDRVPLEYEVENGVGVVRLRLKEGQARRLQVRDLPAFDRPVRFTVVRGKREALRSDTLDDLRRQLGEGGRADGERRERGKQVAHGARLGRGGRHRGR